MQSCEGESLTPEEQKRFNELVVEIEDMFSYQQVTHIMTGREVREIIGMGDKVIQPLLDCLSKGSPLWFMILYDTVRRLPGHTGDVARTVTAVPGNFYNPRIRHSVFEGEKIAWLKWGEENGYQVELPQNS